MIKNFTADNGLYFVTDFNRERQYPLTTSVTVFSPNGMPRQKLVRVVEWHFVRDGRDHIATTSLNATRAEVRAAFGN